MSVALANDDDRRRRRRRRIIRRTAALAVLAFAGASTPWDGPIESLIPSSLDLGFTTSRRVARSLATPSPPPPDLPDDYPTGLRLVLMGDSITRYQYLSLVYYLRNYGQWYDAPRNSTSYLVNERMHPGPNRWMNFLHDTNVLLHPFEQCDCYRFKFDPDEIFEHRYYWDPATNNSVTYIQALGDNKIQSHWDPSTAATSSHWPTKLDMDVVFSGDWPTTIREYISKIEPKPTHLVMNSGLWGSGAFHNTAYAQDILDALHETNLQGIWKTTTPMNIPVPDFAWKAHEFFFCQRLPCFNVGGWAATLNETEQWDGIHFWEPVYRKMNVWMLRMIDELEEKKKAKVEEAKAKAKAKEHNKDPSGEGIVAVQ